MTEAIKTPTPHARWHANGEVDPHKGHYDGNREDQIFGDMTEDELGNYAFLNFDVRPSVADLVSGKANSPMAIMTAVKDRLRWCARQLIKKDDIIKDLNKKSEMIAYKLMEDHYKEALLAKDQQIALLEWACQIGAQVDIGDKSTTVLLQGAAVYAVATKDRYVALKAYKDYLKETDGPD